MCLWCVTTNNDKAFEKASDWKNMNRLWALFLCFPFFIHEKVFWLILQKNGEKTFFHFSISFPKLFWFSKLYLYRSIYWYLILDTWYLKYFNNIKSFLFKLIDISMEFFCKKLQHPIYTVTYYSAGHYQGCSNQGKTKQKQTALQLTYTIMT